MPTDCPVIAHLVPWRGVGGVEQATLRIADAARARGFRNVVLALAGADEVHTLFRDHGFDVVAFDPIQASGVRPGPYVRNARRIARDLGRRGVGLLHCADLMAALYGGLAGRLAGVPVVCHVRNPAPHLTRRDRALLLPVQHYVFVSRDTWRSFAPHVSARRGRVLYDGVPARTRVASSADVRREFGIAPDAPLIGMAARLSPQKDYMTLGLAAVRVLAAVPAARFLIVGDRSSEPAHQAHYATVDHHLRAIGVRDAFVFAGFRSDVDRLLSALDVFVLSTHFEGLPLVVLEAMALGLPTVATAVNGIPEVIQRRDVGVLVPPGDDAALARELIALLVDPVAARRLGDAGQAFVRTTFSHDAFAQGIADLYADLMPARARRAS